MKPALLFFVCMAVLACRPLSAADTNNPARQLSAVIDTVNADIAAGKHTEADLTNDLKALEAFRAKYKDDKNDVMAMALYDEVTIYAEVIGDTSKGDELMNELRHDYKTTHVVQEIEAEEAAAVAAEAAAQKIRDSLKDGAPFPDFDEKDVSGNPVSVANYKGKVVLVDFWATWCVPCLIQLPGVITTYQQFHDKGFEVIGVSLDTDRQRLLDFTKANSMPWPEYNDGHRFDNKLVVKYGVEQIPANFLLDRNGKIIGRDLFDQDLPATVAKALAN